MAERKWTTEQMQAIKLTGKNILVSAAAGSGKTSVLVERIINKIINEKVDIDKILVVTFTNAAASEMRQRLMDAIYKKIDENPNDENLQRQLMLINKANISTIHSFCLSVIRNNFFEIGISNNFRVADETEIEIMKQETIEDIFEEEYENSKKEFQNLLEKYTTYKDDTPLKELILKIYTFIQSNPFPEKWLTDAVEEYNIIEEDFGKTKWGKIILNKLEEDLEECKNKLKEALLEANTYPDLIDNVTMLKNDLEEVEQISTENWNKIYQEINSKAWKSWQGRKKVAEEEKEARENAKNIRNLAKVSLESSKKLFKYSSEENIEDIKSMYETLKIIQNIVLRFDNEFSKRKREKNIVDFNDIEHLALKILVNEDGTPTETAKKYDFNEIEIDEYQDSNSVQEYILNSVSNGHNIFMVGDVKQSIYKFRQANPKLFMQKYNDYVLPEETLTKDTKILLYKNFRSRKNILDITNLVFENIMSKKLGEIEYTEEEALNLGAQFEEPKIDCTTELNIIELNDNDNKEEVNEDSEETQEVVENAALEARLVAKKIKELRLQEIPYKNMTILLRSPKSVASIYEKELMENEIPVFSDITTEYLNTIEIDTIMSLLKIIDNPLQDIPLVTVLRSEIGGFTDNDLIEIRLLDRNSPYFRALAKAKDDIGIREKLKNKVNQFLNLLKKLKDEENVKPLDELIWYIYTETGYYHYVGLMPDGNLRQANLKKLFEKARDYEKISLKGLFNFIIFMEKVGTSSSNLDAARVIGENDDVVRIMSIHKSKGLEFPIVFLCGANKSFNLRDTSEKIVLDNNLGIGANCFINGANYSTLAKEAIKIKADRESISEEMRVLYVALTRAKDKLIIIGTSSNVEKKLLDKENEIRKYYKFTKPHKMNFKLVEKYKSYLDWLELVYKYNDNSFMDLNIINKSELINKEDNEKREKISDDKQGILEKIKLHEIDKDMLEKINKELNFEYKYIKDVELPTKTSVTALKKAKEINKKVPSFALGKEVKGARKGTIIHLILSKIKTEKNVEEVKNLIEDLYNRNIITTEEKKAVNIKIIENYLNSDLYKEILQAKEVKRETPFYLNINSGEIYEGTNEPILVQGVIDLYFISKDNKLILVDYKTDYVKEGKEELIEKYKGQLDLYKIALEKALKRNVDGEYIYSTYLNECFKI